MRKTIEDVINSISHEYKADLENKAPYEKNFIDDDKHWYSPFILWDLGELKEYQASSDLALTEYLSIGSNGGMETYLLSIANGSVFLCDLVAGIESIEKVASSYAELLTLLEQ